MSQQQPIFITWYLNLIDVSHKKTGGEEFIHNHTLGEWKELFAQGHSGAEALDRMKEIDFENLVKEAQEYGFAVGSDIAEENIHDFVWQFFLTEQTVDDMIGEMLQIECEHFRQFSPFEFWAQRLNDSDDPDHVWSKYDNGVYKGVCSVVEEYAAQYSKVEYSL